MDYEFVKLIDYTVAPCKGCLGCVSTNIYVIKDGGIALAAKAKNPSIINNWLICGAIIAVGGTLAVTMI